MSLGWDEEEDEDERPRRRRGRGGGNRPREDRDVATSKWDYYNRLLSPEQRVSLFGPKGSQDEALRVTVLDSGAGLSLLANAYIARRLTMDDDPEFRAQDRLALALATKITIEQKKSSKTTGNATIESPKGDPIARLLGREEQTEEQQSITMRSESGDSR